MKISEKLNKFVNINMLFLVIFYSFLSLLSFPIVVKAITSSGYICSKYVDRNTGIINTTVNFRTGPGTNYSTIKELSKNTKVDIIDGNLIDGKGCANGWIKISQSSPDKYDRPWTTPKKAIVGGAEFISNSYISNGQYTSYLKKFNVNPNSKYEMYNHQYMANLAAPSSEAAKSYSAYSKNNLLNLPLEFSIPVFSDMQDSYNRPTGNLIEIQKQYNVTDQAFEDVLNSQGFPETYKQALRALHNIHPNWIFKSMDSGSFNTAVLVEKNVSSIQGNSSYYEIENGQFISTEPGWYLANSETVAYYLDPRNFLTEKYILQFESLAYSDNYDENVVKSILNNTFMSENSILDNQSYSSIFVEAGKNANISPVYLAALAIQESGVEMKSNTSGAQFEYEGITYSGLFNFFNIGASSSASNPSKAGLVYASGGYCTICGNSQISDNNSNNNPQIYLSTIITQAGFGISSNFVTGISPNTSANSIRERLGAANIKTNGEYIGTGTIIEYNNQSYEVVISGDLNGDGKINSADLLKMRQHLLGSSILNNSNFEAAKLAGNNDINSADLLKLRQILLS